mmetsp:Transcript_5920/g.7302  ORF Transcript_5920/g.7302 Transcript_5920/m.7302 type:complete len:434 (+) Transcript_5920:172-1473(+)
MKKAISFNSNSQTIQQNRNTGSPISPHDNSDNLTIGTGYGTVDSGGGALKGVSSSNQNSNQNSSSTNINYDNLTSPLTPKNKQNNRKDDSQDYLQMVKKVMRKKRASYLIQGIDCDMINKNGMKQNVIVCLSPDWSKLIITYKTPTTMNDNSKNDSENEEEIAKENESFVFNLNDTVALHRGQVSSNFYKLKQRNRFLFSNMFSLTNDKVEAKYSVSIFYSPFCIDDNDHEDNEHEINKEAHKEQSKGKEGDKTNNSINLLNDKNKQQQKKTKKKASLKDDNNSMIVDDVEDEDLSIDFICKNESDFSILYGSIKRALIQSNRVIEQEEQEQERSSFSDQSHQQNETLKQTEEKTNQSNKDQEEEDGEDNMKPSLSPSYESMKRDQSKSDSTSGSGRSVRHQRHPQARLSNSDSFASYSKPPVLPQRKTVEMI